MRCHCVFNFKFIDVTSWVGWIKRTDGRSDGHAKPSQSMMPSLPAVPHPTSPHRRSSQEGRKIRVAFDVTFLSEYERGRKGKKERMMEAQKEYDENQMWLRSIYCQSLCYNLTPWIRFRRRAEIRTSLTGQGEGEAFKFKGICFYVSGYELNCNALCFTSTAEMLGQIEFVN